VFLKLFYGNYYSSSNLTSISLLQPNFVFLWIFEKQLVCEWQRVMTFSGEMERQQIH